MREIKRCPNCKEECFLSYEINRDIDRIYYVFCVGCFMCGPTNENKVIAITKWNNLKR